MNAPLQVRGHNGTVTYDGQFVTIARTGFLARATVGKGEKRIPLRHITAVQLKPGLAEGHYNLGIALTEFDRGHLAGRSQPDQLPGPHVRVPGERTEHGQLVQPGS